jgi:hypothetical protein
MDFGFAEIWLNETKGKTVAPKMVAEAGSNVMDF